MTTKSILDNEILKRKITHKELTDHPALVPLYNFQQALNLFKLQKTTSQEDIKKLKDKVNEGEGMIFYDTPIYRAAQKLIDIYETEAQLITKEFVTATTTIIAIYEYLHDTTAVCGPKKSKKELKKKQLDPNADFDFLKADDKDESPE